MRDALSLSSLFLLEKMRILAACVPWGRAVFIGDYKNSSVWLICLCCVCLEEPGRLLVLSWE